MLGPLLLVFGSILLVIAGAALDWYPSRIGGPAYWLDDHLYQGPVSFLTASVAWPVGAGAVFALALVVSFAGYFVAMSWARGRAFGRGHDLIRILSVQLGLLSWLAVQPYVSSQDIFSYAFYARMLVRYHANPYLQVPRDFPFDPLFSAIFWKDQPSNYGPLWTYLSTIAPLAARDLTGPTLLLLKAIVVAAALGGTPLLWYALGRHDPDRRTLGVVVYAWNPLLLVETGIAGHNDVVMAFFLIVCSCCWLRGHRALSVGSLFLAGLTKYVALLLLPFFVVAWFRRERVSPWTVLLRTAMVGGALTIAAFAPEFSGTRSLSVIAFGTNALAYSNSAMELAFRQIRMAFGASAELADLPLHYNGYWVGVNTSTIIWSEPDPTRATGLALPRGEPLLVVSLPGGQWLHVFEPRIGRFGYVPLQSVHAVAAPRTSTSVATTLAVLLGSAQDPSAQRGNLILRVLSAAILAATLLVLPRGVHSDQSLFRISLLGLLVYLVLVQSWFWPWYLIWAIPFAALAPETAGARLLLALTATASVLNAQPSVSPAPTVEWIYEGRMIAIDGIPVVVALGWWLSRGRPTPKILKPIAPIPSWIGRTLKTTLAMVAFPSAVVASAAAIAVGVAVIWRVTSSPVAPAVIAWQRAFDLAQHDLSAGSDDAAVQAVNLVLIDRPNELSAVRLRLSANLDMRRYADAIPDLTRLLANNPDDLSLVLERGTLYEQIQRDDRATLDFRRAIDLSPADPAGYAGAGQVAFERGDLIAANSWLAQAEALAPGDGRVDRAQAAVLAVEGKLPEARDLFDRAIALNPSDAQTYAARAAFLRYAGYDASPLPDLHHVLVLSGDVQEHRWAAHLLADLIGLPTQSVEWTE